MSHRDRRALFVQGLIAKPDAPVPTRDPITAEGRALAMIQAERMADIQTVALEIAQQGIERNRGR